MGEFSTTDRFSIVQQELMVDVLICQVVVRYQHVSAFMRSVFRLVNQCQAIRLATFDGCWVLAYLGKFVGKLDEHFLVGFQKGYLPSMYEFCIADCLVMRPLSGAASLGFHGLNEADLLCKP